MKKKQSYFPLFVALLSMMLLIIDSQTAADSVRRSIELCITTLIPNLFCLFVLCGYLVGYLVHLPIPWLSRIGNLPRGTEGLFLIGILGGFPVGAVSIRQAVDQRKISAEEGERILGFCNNCGPAFLFGILGTALSSVLDAAILCLIQCLSAILISAYWPEKTFPSTTSRTENEIHFSLCVTGAVRSMVSVCAWVTVAGVLIGFLKCWLFPLIPPVIGLFATGFLELTNGTLAIACIPNRTQSLILLSGLINFGGVSVFLQIHGIISDLNISMAPCILQKICQSLVGTILAILWYTISPWCILLPIMILLKKAVAIRRNLVYNVVSKGGV